MAKNHTDLKLENTITVRVCRVLSNVTLLSGGIIEIYGCLFKYSRDKEISTKMLMENIRCTLRQLPYGNFIRGRYEIGKECSVRTFEIHLAIGMR